jgi:hypothetical protein
MRTHDRYRGTLHIPEMIEEYGLQAAIAVNNVGNAFTPQGNCDPLSVASLGVGLYSRGTLSDMDLLFVRSYSFTPAGVDSNFTVGVRILSVKAIYWLPQHVARF